MVLLSGVCTQGCCPCHGQVDRGGWAGGTRENLMEDVRVGLFSKSQSQKERKELVGAEEGLVAVIQVLGVILDLQAVSPELRITSEKHL